MMERNEQRPRGIAVGLESEQTPLLTTWFQDGDAGAAALASARGYRRVRVFHHMVRPTIEGIETPPLPDGLEVRPLSTDRTREYWAALCQALSLYERHGFHVHSSSSE